jgi:hypothetical protein
VEPYKPSSNLSNSSNNNSNSNNTSPYSSPSLNQSRFPPAHACEALFNRVSIAFAQDLDVVWECEATALQEALAEALSSLDPCADVLLFAKEIHEVRKTSESENSRVFFVLFSLCFIYPLFMRLSCVSFQFSHLAEAYLGRTEQRRPLPPPAAHYGGG